MKKESGKVSRSSFSSIALRHSRQVHMRKKMVAPTTSGTQPPSKIFIMLAVTKDRSTVTNSPATMRLTARRQCQMSRIARNIRIEVSNMVIDTAMPKAAAKLSEDRNDTVKTSVSAIKIQLTKPT